MKLNWQRISLHILFWAVYVPLNAVLNCILQRVPLEESFREALIGEFFSLPVKLLLTYFVFYYVIPLYLDRSKIYKLVGLLLAAFVVATVVYRLEIAYVYFPIFRPGETYNFLNPKGLLLTEFDLFITLAAAVTIKMIRVHYKSLEFEQELMREKLQSELSFLRAQTNPHFLFNTLNNLYVLARKKSDKTPDAIMMLSKIMRFVLYECRAPRISVMDEAKIIQDYIELEKLRYSKRLTVDYHEEIDNPVTSIAPLLLLPFVENSFKHGAGGTTGDVAISIRISLHEQKLSFVVQNTMDPDGEGATGIAADVGGIGLRNVQRQLALIYPDQHELTTTRDHGLFTANLKINLSY
ncbi:MAG: histidine kinase [Chitinophagales bacterium]|nr:histidine kinase [Chitinophagales bacterium]